MWNSLILGSARLCRIGFAAMLAAGIMAPSGTAAVADTLKLGFILSPASQLGQGASVFAAEVERRTSGRYHVVQYPNAMLGGELEMIKAVRTGTVDLAFITGAALPSVVNDVGIFNIPFLFEDVTEARLVLDGPIGELYLAKFASADLVALAWGENGLRHVTSSAHPIRSPDDLKGLKLRVPQSAVISSGLKFLGADVQQLHFPKV